MKKLFVLLILLGAGGVGFGFYRSWFQVSTANEDHKTRFILTVDRDKIHDDKEIAKAKIGGLTSSASAKEKSSPEAGGAEKPQAQP
jgi:hypothetical protein